MLRKVHFSGDFLGAFEFLRSASSLRISLKSPINLIKCPVFTNTPCKTTFLYNAPGLRTVDYFPCFFRAELKVTHLR